MGMILRKDRPQCTHNSATSLKCSMVTAVIITLTSFSSRDLLLLSYCESFSRGTCHKIHPSQWPHMVGTAMSSIDKERIV
jgi:hypothetical protein